jgi:hypothetical protein
VQVPFESLNQVRLVGHRKLKDAGFGSAAAQLLTTRKRAELEDMMSLREMAPQCYEHKAENSPLD